MNTQAPTKQELVNDGTLLVHSMFKTIQGEGPFVGVPCVFIRLAGCNLQCPLCDTEYTTGAERLTVRQVYSKARRLYPATTLIVLTGGEPFRQQITPLLSLFANDNIQVQIETNGSLYLDSFSYVGLSNKISVVCSPKAGRVNRMLVSYIKAWKYVATAESIDPTDGLPMTALDHPASPRLMRPPPGALVYLQPVDEGNEERNRLNLEAVIASCYKFGHRLGLQIHKIIGVA